MKLKRGLIQEHLPELLIAVAILVVLLLSIFFMKGAGGNIIDKIKNLFTFR